MGSSIETVDERGLWVSVEGFDDLREPYAAGAWDMLKKLRPHGLFRLTADNEDGKREIVAAIGIVARENGK